MQGVPRTSWAGAVNERRPKEMFFWAVETEIEGKLVGKRIAER